MSGSPVENVIPGSSDTLLSITGMGNFHFQARGLTQTLEVIQAASQLQRDVNGNLIDMSAPQFRKYQTTIEISNEVNAPPIDGFFPGMEVTVDCVCSLSYVTGTTGSPNRTVVSGSDWTEGVYTFYRPQLTMLVKSISESFDEWGNKVGWTIALEEV